MNIMEHLTESQLNEYLDGLLEAPARAGVQSHLSNCAECQARLATLQTVFQTLAALPKETPGRDLTPSVLQALPHRSIGRVWRLAFAIQAGMSLGFLLLLLPVITDHIAGKMVGMVGQFSIPEVKFPSPINFHVSPPAILLPHPPSLALPISITQANSPVWLILGIAALALCVLGNFSLVFHSRSKP